MASKRFLKNSSLNKIDGLGEIERAYDHLNKTLFNKQLEKVSFSIQIKKKVALRWCSESNAIIIGMDIIKLGFEEILGVLLHEMIHIANHQSGIIDVTANQYHNKYFLKLALAVGMMVAKHKTQGWAITSIIFPINLVERIFIKHPTKEAVKTRVDSFDGIKLDKLAYEELQNQIQQKIKQEKPTKTYFLKYQCKCPPPHNSIRSGRRPDGLNVLHIQCLDCRSQFECVTDIDVENGRIRIE